MLSPAAVRMANQRLGMLQRHLHDSSPEHADPPPHPPHPSGTSGGDGKKGLKVYISVDIEGVAGAAHWDEAAKAHSDYGQFAERMTAEAVAACEGKTRGEWGRGWVAGLRCSGGQGRCWPARRRSG